jgi:hypothetical protein
MTDENRSEPQKIVVPIKCSTVKAITEIPTDILGVLIGGMYNTLNYKVFGQEIGLLLIGCFGLFLWAGACAFFIVGLFTYLWEYPGFIMGCIAVGLITFILCAPNLDIKFVCKEE